MVISKKKKTSRITGSRVTVQRSLLEKGIGCRTL